MGLELKDIELSNKWLFLFSGLTSKNLNGYFKSIEKGYFEDDEELTTLQWSKSLIRQLLTYLSISDEQGRVGIVDAEEISIITNCSMRTIVNNNRLLESNGLIKLESLYGGLDYIELNEYYRSYLDLYSYQNSFTEMNSESNQVFRDEQKKIKNLFFSRNTVIKKDTFLKMLDLKEINTLRIVCLIISLYDIEAKINNKDMVIITYGMLKDLLPQYCFYKPALKQLLEPLSNLFDMKVLDGNELIQFVNSLSTEERKDLLVKKNLREPFLLIIASIK